MIDPEQLRDYVVTPALKDIQFYSQSAMRLVVGTAMVESGLVYLHQLGEGPALGLWQMEPATHKSLWNDYLLYRLHIAQRMNEFNMDYRDHSQLVWNLKYAAAMCRIKYLTSPSPLPHAHDIGSMAYYWKDIYNTSLGAGKPEDFLEHSETLLTL